MILRLKDLDFISDLVFSKVDEIIYYGAHETHIKYHFGSIVKYSQVKDIKGAFKIALESQTNNSTILFLQLALVFQYMKISK